MKTLYERLKPEYKDVLNNERDNYPHTASDIEKQLKSNKFVVDLRYGLLITLDAWFKCGNKPYELFEDNE